MEDLEFIIQELDNIKSKSNPTTEDLKNFDMLLKAKRLILGQTTENFTDNLSNEEIEQAQQRLLSKLTPPTSTPVMASTKVSLIINQLKRKKSINPDGQEI